MAVDQPRRGRGCACAEVALLQKDHPQAASRGVARNADAVQAAADDRKIVVRHAQGLEHDPEKWKPVFPRDKREAFARKIMLKQNMRPETDSTQLNRSLAGLARGLHRIAAGAADQRGVLPDRRRFADKIAL